MQNPMSRRWRRAALAAAAAATLAGGSQAQEGSRRPAAEPGANGPGANGPSRPGTAPGGPAEPGASEYTIQRGDTLWDLSQKFLNSPWYWPKLWSLNPQIENAHWIYPGNKLKIQPGQGGAPGQIEPNAPVAQSGQPEDLGGNEPKPTDQPTTPSLTASAEENAAADKMVSSAGRLAFASPKALSVRASGMVSEQEMAESGSLDASFEEKQMLWMYDTAYVRFKRDGAVRVGDKVLLYRPAGQILSPTTGKPVAMRTKTVGEAKVISTEGQMVTIAIGRTWEEVERGDLVRPWIEQYRRTTPMPNRRQVDGIVLGAVSELVSTLGESQEVFLDKGRVDGVELGNTFYVVRRGDGLTLKGGGMADMGQSGGEAGEKANQLVTPEENVALLLVIDVRDSLSTAIVVRSIREIEAGDRVQMRPAGSGGF